jgi:methionyl-tRNA synthetase
MDEDTYFFQMSRIQKWLREHIHSNPSFIQPESSKHEILARLEEPLRDISISRSSFNWGIQLPNDPDHVMYVWFDALTNYLSVLSYQDENSDRRHYWPAAVHIVGRDITWFHAVIWPCILHSTGIPIPKSIFSHGFVLDAKGHKMSKSIGNVVDPFEILKRYGTDSFRYFLLREGSFGKDTLFNEDHLIQRSNSELNKKLGNYVHRVIALTHRYCNGKVPLERDEIHPINVESVFSKLQHCFDKREIHEACAIILSNTDVANKYLTDLEPWKLNAAPERQRGIIGTCLEMLFLLAHIFEPFIPSTSDTILTRLHVKIKTFSEISSDYNNLPVGSPVDVGDILFQQLRQPK